MLLTRAWTQLLIHNLKRPSSTNGQVKRHLSRSTGQQQLTRFMKHPLTLPPLLAFSLYLYTEYGPKDGRWSWGLFAECNSVNEQQKKLLEKVDELFEANKLDEMMNLLKSMSSWYDNNEVLWRVARCQYHQLKYRTDKGSKEYNEILENSYSLIERSLEIDEKCGPAQKWAAIILDAYSSAQGTKVRVANLGKFKEHAEKAIKFSPNDPTAYYLLGEWHFACASVSWVERNLANLVFGTLPEASYETALEMFEKAEKIEPGFYSKNQIMIAKTLLALNREKEKATIYLKTIVNKYKGSEKWDDAEAFKEASNLLYKMGEKV